MNVTFKLHPVSSQFGLFLSE